MSDPKALSEEELEEERAAAGRYPDPDNMRARLLATVDALKTELRGANRHARTENEKLRAAVRELFVNLDPHPPDSTVPSPFAHARPFRGIAPKHGHEPLCAIIPCAKVDALKLLLQEKP